MKNQSLQDYLDRRMDQPTVILCFRILLDNIIANGVMAGMSTIEISSIFDSESRSFGVQRFRTDYIRRQSGAGGANAIYEKDEKFFIFQDYLEGLTLPELIEISKSINKRYTEKGKVRQAFMEEISLSMSFYLEKRKEYILDMLLTRETDRKGQCFEVTAFAILKTFYSIRGFELNRFSTIYSNDGGIDYSSQTSVYQVTTKLTDAKFNEDVVKAPLKQRIFVYREAVSGFDFEKMKSELVSDYIDANDLKNHLDYMLSKKPEENSSLIVQTIFEEFRREYYY